MTANPSPRPILESPERRSIAVIGAGSWGTTLAQLLAEKGKDVRLWVREPDVCEALRRDRINHTFLPGIRLSSRITFTQEFPAALDGAGVVLMAVPSHGFRQTLRRSEAALPPRGGAAQRHQGHGDRLPPHHGGGGPGGNGGGNPLCGAGRPQLRPGSGPETAHRRDRRLPAAGDRPLHPATLFRPPLPGVHVPRYHRGGVGGGPEEHLCHRHRDTFRHGPGRQSSGRRSSPGAWPKWSGWGRGWAPTP